MRVLRPLLPGSLLAVFVLGILPPLAPAETPIGKPLAPAWAAAVDQAVTAELEKQAIVGAAVGILQSGEIVYLKGYGEADREKHLPATQRTVFNWASNCKPLAAVAAMQLVEKRLLDLEADVRKYVPEFPRKGAVITPRHLLCHQSGIPHYTNGLVLPTTRTYTHPLPFLDPVLALDVFNQSPLLFQPGEKVSYSSYAYVLLSAVIQRAGREPFPTQVAKRIAKPAGMKSLQLDLGSHNQENWAAGYLKDASGRVSRAKEEANYWKHGAGGFKSDIEDFARWAKALLNRRLVSEESQQKMWTAQAISAGEKTTWGLGFMIEDQDGLKVSHNGKQDEATTRLVLYPTARHGVVVMCNCGFANVGAISTAIYTALDPK